MSNRTDNLIDPPPITLGPCCVCCMDGLGVRNVVTLHQKSPIAGKGWGCLTCRIEMDGALAVLCDACLDAKAKPQWACRGWPAQDGRIPIEELAGIHQHDLVLHPESAPPAPAQFAHVRPLTIWVITDRPSDFPNHVVVRARDVYPGIELPWESAMTFESIEDARSLLRPHGLTPVGRNPGDDPVIVESWL